ncbi:MAG: hypothetical protein RLZZ366_1145 [Pseudomonadota bacterium]
MARTSTATTTEPKTPAFQAWHVTNKGDDSFWTKVGAAWPHGDGNGLSLILSVIPTITSVTCKSLALDRLFSHHLWSMAKRGSGTERRLQSFRFPSIIGKRVQV